MSDNVIPLRQPASSVTTDEAIMPKSLLSMTDLEHEQFLRSLRERRLIAAQKVKAARAAQVHASSVAASMKIEKKAEQADRQMKKVEDALDKLEKLIVDLRALQLQYTDEFPTPSGAPNGTSVNA